MPYVINNRYPCGSLEIGTIGASVLINTKTKKHAKEEDMVRRKNKYQTFAEMYADLLGQSIVCLEKKACTANGLAHQLHVSRRKREALFRVKQKALEQAIALAPERYRVSQWGRCYIGVARRNGVRLHIKRCVRRETAARWVAAEAFLRAGRRANSERGVGRW